MADSEEQQERATVGHSPAERAEEPTSSAEEPGPGAAAEQDSAPSGEPDPADKMGEMADSLVDLLGEVARRSWVGIERAASDGRVRLDLRQLRKDRSVMYQKLGREVRALVEGGEVSHPGLARGVHRIEELDARIAAIEATTVED
ncbi:MAG: hypothetical protein QGG40_10600 [Myxococcota bacterium]|nr:hypothetical protein [Myxococcota bacterium]